MAGSREKVDQQPVYGAAIPLSKSVMLDRDTLHDALREMVGLAGARVRMIDEVPRKRGILSGLRSQPSEFGCEIAGVRLVIRVASQPLCSAAVMHSFINPAIWRGALTGMTGHRADELNPEKNFGAKIAP